MSVVLYFGLILAPRQLDFATYILGIPKFYASIPLLFAAASMIVTTVYYILAVRWSAAVLGNEATLNEIEDNVLVVNKFIVQS